MLANDSDPDGANLTAVVGCRPANGASTSPPPARSPTPPTPTSTAPTPFTYTVTDDPTANTATVDVTVTEIDDAATAVDDGPRWPRTAHAP